MQCDCYADIEDFNLGDEICICRLLLLKNVIVLINIWTCMVHCKNVEKYKGYNMVGFSFKIKHS
jgi:hypothetical protein